MKKTIYKLECIITSAIVCFLLWMAFTWSVEPSELITGVIVSLIVGLFCSRFFIHKKPLALFNPVKWARFLFFLIAVFLPELIRANWHMAMISLGVYDTYPGIVRIKTDLKNEYAISLLANSITLTPGTITVDVAELDGQSYLYVHLVQDEKKGAPLAGEEIKGKMESCLKKIFD